MRAYVSSVKILDPTPFSLFLFLYLFRPLLFTARLHYKRPNQPKGNLYADFYQYKSENCVVHCCGQSFAIAHISWPVDRIRNAAIRATRVAGIIWNTLGYRVF